MARPVVRVEVELRPGESAESVGDLIVLAGDYMKLAETFPTEGIGWHIAGRVHVYREDFGD